jgi:hypothetical protein
MKHRMQLTTSSRESGFALPAVVLVVALLAIVALGSITTVGNEAKSSRFMRESARAFYAAESGLEYVMATWDSAQYDVSLVNPGDTLDLGWIPLPENRTAFRAVLQRVDDGSGDVRYGVRVMGRGGIQSGTMRSVSTVVSVTGGSSPPFEWGIFGDEGVTINHGGPVNGPVGSNKDVKITGNAEVKGKVKAGGQVTGKDRIKPEPGKPEVEIEEFDPPGNLEIVPCPTTAYGPSPGGKKVSFNSTTGNMSIQGGPDVVFNGGTYYFNDFTKQGSNMLIVPQGETVIMYVAGTLDIWGDGFQNPEPNTAGNLQIYGCGTSTVPWRLGGDGRQSMALYAPTHPLTLSSDGKKFGAFVAGKITKNHDGEILFDEKLKDLKLPGSQNSSNAQGGPKKLTRGSWASF